MRTHKPRVSHSRYLCQITSSRVLFLAQHRQRPTRVPVRSMTICVGLLLRLSAVLCLLWASLAVRYLIGYRVSDNRNVFPSHMTTAPASAPCTTECATPFSMNPSSRQFSRTPMAGDHLWESVRLRALRGITSTPSSQCLLAMVSDKALAVLHTPPKPLILHRPDASPES